MWLLGNLILGLWHNIFFIHMRIRLTVYQNILFFFTFNDTGNPIMQKKSRSLGSVCGEFYPFYRTNFYSVYGVWKVVLAPWFWDNMYALRDSLVFCKPFRAVFWNLSQISLFFNEKQNQLAVFNPQGDLISAPRP